MTSLNGHSLVQRTESGEDLLDTVNLLAGVTESVEYGTADVEPRLMRAVLQQMAALLDAYADRRDDPAAKTAFRDTAAQLRNALTRIRNTAG